ncbi:type 4a pilus biogenesis protein PilO [Photobacterium nomapromontoriensis]|uniref:type 4a pilus biogenesis protein PilO n=1 Tax=Photobacterium nomapromontoriensis TaxID=2910237 RepID=UPI003D0C2214
MSDGRKSISDWKDLELDEITEWPVLAQLLVALILAGMIAAIGNWYWLSPIQDDLARVKQTEQELRQQLIRRSNQVAALPVVKLQVEELQDRYQYVIEQLPEEEELASLLADVNDIGVRNGLAFQRIEWANSIDHPLYVELPISIELTGKYQDIGNFSADIASLSRIVSLNDIDLKRTDNKTEQLSLKVSATTYRFKASERSDKGDK